ncbi:homogentisate geranylgeranyltransferase [Citrus sinensis]|uniref:Homogentisate geranylgeranyltransferase n=1 Tax=Citrus sinensis TaxID=2711 RepID=A0ACB8N111_CITSI|nr:homogentisate geranylgeranyltransferase [Citrus sinensis]
MPQRNPIPPRAVSEFERIHFPIPSLAKRFEDRFNGRKVLDSYYVDIEDFRTLIVRGRSVRDMLQRWESAIDFDDRVYPNLVRVFYSNMEISATRLDKIVTQVGGVPIEFDVELLNNILGISNDSHIIYTSRKALSFSSFAHQLVRILYTILQHIVTPKKGHSDEVTRLDVGLLDSLITGRSINLGYVIVRQMLSTPAVNHRLLPYGNIITKILRRFEPPASVQPPASDSLQQLADDVRRISERQQLIITRLDTLSRDQQQLRSEFHTFQHQSIDQQLELIAGQRTLLRYFGYDPGVIAITSVSLLSLQNLDDLTPTYFIRFLKAMVPGLLMTVYEVAINQLYDVAIDKVNKPNLPLTSGDLSMRTGIAIASSSLLMSLAMGIMHRSPPFLLALIIWFLLGSAYSVDDIPDEDGDREFGIRTLSVILGKESVLWLCVYVLVIAYGAAVIVGLTSSPYLLSKLVTIISHSMLATLLWHQAQTVDLSSKASTLSFYMFIWKLHLVEYLIIPFVRL